MCMCLAEMESKSGVSNLAPIFVLLGLVANQCESEYKARARCLGQRVNTESKVQGAVIITTELGT